MGHRSELRRGVPVSCKATTKEGKPCNARAMSSTGRCIMHSDPAVPARLGRIGAEQRAQRRTAAAPVPEFAPPKDAAELRVLISNVIIETRAGRLDPKV